MRVLKRSLGGEDPLEKGMAPPSSILTWRITWTEDPSRLQSIGSQRVWLDQSDLAHTHFIFPWTLTDSLLCAWTWAVLHFVLGRVFLSFQGFIPSSCLYFMPGNEVRFGVDCTHLADAFELQDREFDRIYFNFPHCGRKAGVAKNRELLAKFFRRWGELSTHEWNV